MPPGDGAGVAVCTLTDGDLARRVADLPGVEIAAPLRTANLGIEDLVRGVLARPSLRALLVCGADSRLFRPGQSLVALLRHGVTGDGGWIAGAEGYQPRLPGLTEEQVARFRDRVVLRDARGLTDLDSLAGEVAELGRTAARHTTPVEEPADGTEAPAPTELRPVGRRRDLRGALEGFVVVTTDHDERTVHLRVFGEDLTLRHRMRGRRAESMVLGLLDAGVVTDPAHAAYLGTELGKAETALRLGLRYEQDLPLRRRPETERWSS